MQKDSAQKKPHTLQAQTPLDRLSDLVSGDMARVNTLILQNMQSDVALIPQLAQYLIAAGGKRIRPIMTLAVTRIFDGSIDKACYLAAAVEFIHTATLLHDDVVDESDARRGQKAAHLVFGNQASVLVGDFLFSKSFQMMVESESLRILRLLSGAAATIAQGEVLQLTIQNDINTSMESYLKVIESKTAALFSAACEIGPILGNCDEATIRALSDYGTYTGTAFQISDDTLDYDASHESFGKEIGDDFREGKITAPILFALEQATAEERAFWQRTLGESEQNENDFTRALELLNKYNVLQKSHELAYDYARRARDCLIHIPESEIKECLVALPEYTVSRHY